MALIIQKFGGSSVADAHHVFNVAKKITDLYCLGNSVVVVVSAQGDTTDHLQKMAFEITSNPCGRENDALLAAGEQISASLLAMAIQKLGYKAVSLTGWQAGFLTNTNHTEAEIENIDTSRIKEELSKKNIVIVAGFQGTDRYGNITTLGRGGSDTSAVALAAALGADVCKIYTDVDGVYSADPRIVSSAKKWNSLSYDEMYELSRFGAQVLHKESIKTARENNVKIEVLSSLVSNPTGTLIKTKEKSFHTYVTGVSIENSLTKFLVTFEGNNKNSIEENIFYELESQNINTDKILKPVGRINSKQIVFTVKDCDVNRCVKTLENLLKNNGSHQIAYEKGKSMISVINISESININVASLIFEALSESNIEAEMVGYSNKRVSVILPSENAQSAANAIHSKIFEEDNII